MTDAELDQLTDAYVKAYRRRVTAAEALKAAKTAVQEATKEWEVARVEFENEMKRAIPFTIARREARSYAQAVRTLEDARDAFNRAESEDRSSLAAETNALRALSMAVPV
jgi:uncharacterized protein YlxW (UPF0749 family)